MHDFTVVSPECVQGRDCGSPAAAIIMFVLYYIVCTYIFVNLLTVVSICKGKIVDRPLDVALIRKRRSSSTAFRTLLTSVTSSR